MGQGHVLGPGMTFQSLGLSTSSPVAKPSAWTSSGGGTAYTSASTAGHFQGQGFLCGGPGPEAPGWDVELGRGTRLQVSGALDFAPVVAAQQALSCSSTPTPTPLLTRKDLRRLSAGRGWPPGQTSTCLHWALAE